MRVGIVLISLKGIRLEKSFRLGFQASNNEAEYDVFLAGLWISKQAEVAKLQQHYDFLLVVNQVNGEFEAKDQRMVSYLKEVRNLKGQFESVDIS